MPKLHALSCDLPVELGQCSSCLKKQGPHLKKPPEHRVLLLFHSWDLDPFISDVQKIWELGLNYLCFRWLHLQILLANDEVRAQTTPDTSLHP